MRLYNNAEFNGSEAVRCNDLLHKNLTMKDIMKPILIIKYPDTIELLVTDKIVNGIVITDISVDRKVVVESENIV